MNFIEISYVQITEKDIAKVVEYSGVSFKTIHKYLNSNEQDDNILKSFAFIGVHPIGKFFQNNKNITTDNLKSNNNTVTMGCKTIGLP